MANVPGKQPDVRDCPRCKGRLQSVPRSQMKSRGYRRANGTISPDTHTYDCIECQTRFEINQDR